MKYAVLAAGLTLLAEICLGAGTGFFRLEQVEGKWQALDPEGAPYVLLGVDHVNPKGMFCEKLKYSPYARHVERKYTSKSVWAEETIARLKEWGFTALGAGSDVELLGHHGLSHTVFLSMGDRLCYGDTELWIRKSKYAPCTAFPNVFHPDFAKCCDERAKEKCAPSKDDPWLFGYFIDNELAWWGKGNNAEGMFDAVRELPEGHSARKALEDFVNGREVSKDLKIEFLRLVADRYFAVTTEAIRRHDPNHLIMGCRFAGLKGAHIVVWQAAAKYCDLVTFNCYPWADLDRNVVLNEKGGRPIVEIFDEFYAQVGKPMLVTEWSFPALDTGRPCLYGAGQRFKTQRERVKAAELFAKTMLALPYFIGYDYFMWVDQPALGMNRYFPEDSNYGLVCEDGAQHTEITEMFRKLHGEISHWRRAGIPKERAVKAQVLPSQRELYLAAAPKDGKGVEFERNETEWILRNDRGVELRGVLSGRSDAVSSVIRNGRRFGSLGVLVELEKGKTVWRDVREIRGVKFLRKGGVGIVRVRTQGIYDGQTFEVGLEISLASGREDFVAEITALKNAGDSPMSVKALFLRPYAGDKDVTVARQVPGLWKGDRKAAWEFSDGGRYEILSNDSSVRSLGLWLDASGGRHPDVAFKAEVSELLPGAVHKPESPASALIRCDCPL